MTFNTAWMLTARDWFIRKFARFWLWIKHADTIVCRDCGQEVQVEMLLSFVDAGCLNCGGTKLKAVKS